MKNIFFLLFLISAISFSQDDNWVDITDHDLKFKIPENYDLKEIQGVKTYVYQGTDKIISLLIIKENKDIENHELKKYYKGFIEGVTQKTNEVISYDTYKIQGHLVAKNIQKTTYSNGNQNFVELHVVHLNGHSYLGRVEYPTNPLDKVIQDKNLFFESFYFDVIHKKEGQNSDSTFILEKPISQFLLLVLLAVIVIFMIKKRYHRNK